MFLIDGEGGNKLLNLLKLLIILKTHIKQEREKNQARNKFF